MINGKGLQAVLHEGRESFHENDGPTIVENIACDKVRLSEDTAVTGPNSWTEGESKTHP